MGKRVVTQTMVEACAEVYTKEQLESYRDAASKALLEDKPRVVMTSTSMKDSTHSGTWIEGDPEFILNLVKRAIAWLERDVDNTTPIANQSMNHADFSRRPVGW